MIDPNSHTWAAVAEWAEKQLASKQMRLEGPLDQPDTDRARGYIFAMRELLKLSQPLDHRLLELQQQSRTNSMKG